MTRLKQIWIDIKNSFWFLPTLIVFFLIILSISVVELDRYFMLSQRKLPIPWSTFKLESVRTFLATIAASMITIAGVVFSITILVLAQTAGQYSSRVLRNFMKNRSNQIILGIFVGIFVFCLFSITILHPEDNAITAFSGLILAITGVGFLVYYIHRTSLSIQATEILRNIYLETKTTIEKLFPEGEKREPASLPLGQFTLPTRDVGFLQAVDTQALILLATQYDTEIQLCHYLGDFLSLGDIVCYLEKDHPKDAEFCNRFYRALVVGKYRTAEEDPLYGIEQTTDIALRGLSHSNNDLTTAQTALSYLSSLYALLINRHFGDSLYYVENRPLLSLPIPPFILFLEKGFGMICHEARRHPPIQKHILDAIEKLKKLAKDPQRKEALSSIEHLCQ